MTVVLGICAPAGVLFTWSLVEPILVRQESAGGWVERAILCGVVGVLATGLLAWVGRLTQTIDRHRRRADLVRRGVPCLKAALERPIEGTIRIDEKLGVQHFDRLAQCIWGWSYQEVRGRDCAMLVSDSATSALRKHFQRGQKEEWGAPLRLPGRRKDQREFLLRLTVRKRATVQERTKNYAYVVRVTDDSAPLPILEIIEALLSLNLSAGGAPARLQKLEEELRGMEELLPRARGPIDELLDLDTADTAGGDAPTRLEKLEEEVLRRIDERRSAANRDTRDGASSTLLCADMVPACERMARLKGRLPELAEELTKLEHLLDYHVPSALNKMRYITEAVLGRLCDRDHVSWGKGEPTVENMIGELTASGSIPKDTASYVKTVQIHTSPGSHYQKQPLSATHAALARDALVALLAWYADQVTQSA